jgi:thymidylate synthase (FAD)
MKVIDASYEVLTPLNGVDILKFIERVGRVCYKSEGQITDDSYLKLVKMLVERGHEAMLEHYNFSVKFISNRGFTHELVRHRVASFAQESTRWCNYSQDKFGGELTFIRPLWTKAEDRQKGSKTRIMTVNGWLKEMESVEMSYLHAVRDGLSPQDARGILPNDLKTEIVITANLREWRHIFKLRTAKVAHPDMRFLMIPLCREIKSKIPVVFDDIEVVE